MKFTLRALTPDDWQIWKEIRLESLKIHPEAFGSSYEESSQMADDSFRRALQDTFVFGAFKEQELIGVARFAASQGVKQKHKGSLISVYLKKEHRGAGIAEALIKKVIEHAKTQVSQLHCTVVADNTAAVELYKKLGFKLYGTEPRSLRVAGKFYDEFLMVLMFT